MEGRQNISGVICWHSEETKNLSLEVKVISNFIETQETAVVITENGHRETGKITDQDDKILVLNGGGKIIYKRGLASVRNFFGLLPTVSGKTTKVNFTERLEEKIISDIIERQEECTIILRSGFQAHCRVIEQDEKVLITDDGEYEHMLYKDTISTIVRK